MKALEVYCDQHALRVDEWMQDFGSGLNYKCKQFNRLMEMVELGQVRRIIIAHRDRLVRFGYGYFEAFRQRHHTDLVVIGGETLSPEQELVQDLVAILSVFSARLHGLRSYRKSLKEAALQKEEGMNRAHVIRLNPTAQQETYFRKACGVARHAYNWALARWKEAQNTTVEAWDASKA